MVRPLKNARRGSWAPLRYSLVIALLLCSASMLLYPGGYSFTHNFLSDLGSTVTDSGAHNAAGAVLMGISLLIGALALAGAIVATVRLLSATPRARALARLAAVTGMLVCAGFVGVALTPEDRAWRLHTAYTMVAFRSFPVATALLAIATMRDGRFRVRASAGWVTLTIVLVGLIAMAHLGPSSETERGLMIQVVAQKIMAATVLVVLWIESREAEAAHARTLAPEAHL